MHCYSSWLKWIWVDITFDPWTPHHVGISQVSIPQAADIQLFYLEIVPFTLLFESVFMKEYEIGPCPRNPYTGC